MGRAQPQQVTPHTAGDVDVVFKLSLRRKRKHRDNKERKWPGPAHPVSLVRHPPHPPQLPPPSPAEAANNSDRFLCLSKRTQVRDTGGVEHTGGGVAPPTRPHRSQQKNTSLEVGLQEVVGSVSGNLLPIHAGGQEARGTSCLLSAFHHWAVGGSQQVGGDSERESCPRVTQC